jgi:DNA modification methylase
VKESYILIVDKINYKLYKGDCLDELKKISDKSVNLVLIDPPYNIKKAEWDKWKTVDDYVGFMGKVFFEIQRVLKDNGSFYFFHNDFLEIVELQNWINKNTEFKFKSLITWNKTNFKKFAWTNRNPQKCNDRNWFPNVEYCLYYTFQDETGLNKILIKDNFLSVSEKIRRYIDDNFKRDYIVDLFQKEGRYTSRLSAKVHASYKCGWNNGKRFDLMDEKMFNYLNEYLCFPFKYEELRREYEDLRCEYEKERYVFNLEEVKENISCVWENKDGNSGKLHSCQKPLDILEKIVRTSSNDGDVVLDCFMGSGSTGVACLNINRKFIGIELDEKYFNISCERLKNIG